jgi:ABC-type Fe3+ transport system permease subunit
MPFSPSILPWWGWFLCALPLRFASWFFSTLYEEAKHSGRSSKSERAWERSLAAIFWIAAFLCAIVGLVMLFMWAFTTTAPTDTR